MEETESLTTIQVKKIDVKELDVFRKHRREPNYEVFERIIKDYKKFVSESSA